MKQGLKLLIATAILVTSLLAATRDAAACLRACTIKCIPGNHCVILNGCARCVPN
ncbi:MAG: hypothetical protein M3O15_07810 [Acidobacteriota bacterium]|nr:hypothetical protein [Acidobacteriota bacterium]